MLAYTSYGEVAPIIRSYERCIFFQVIKVDHEAHGVDTPADIAKIEALMKEKNLK
jgi:CMP-2-keto-3-deoxyoctulosonic acid synthetase